MPEFFNGVSVLEIGSYNVNGSVRQFFNAPKRYIGVDLIEGPGVDVVCDGDKFYESVKFDVAISTECFEHTADYLAIFENMTALVRPGGLVMFTCATTGRAEHGTPRTSPKDSPGTCQVSGDRANYYRNVTADHFPELDLDIYFSSRAFFVNEQSHDLYFLGVKFGGKSYSVLFPIVAQRLEIRMLG